MDDTKVKILMTALKLFARDGYEAVSVRDIAQELGITKGALYRHYKNKRDIFDNIVERMIQIDAERAEEHRMPVEKYDKMSDSYKNTAWEDIEKYTVEQLKFWTEDGFASLFRRMLTLEQYRNEESAQLYSQCIVEGPVAYTEALFSELIKKGVLKDENPKQLAVEYYSPLFLLISMFDKKGENEEYVELLRNHTKRFIQNHGVKFGGEK
ncbi:MAG: TetR/AcrR family transcriptional regulator [Clostridia bacterium]|nr:TetR/AcrR family transcriptional regulator [Clostridia bacterium]